MRWLPFLVLIFSACDARSQFVENEIDFSFEISDSALTDCSGLLACEEACRGHASCQQICAQNASASALATYDQLFTCSVQACADRSDSDGGAPLCAGTNDTSVVCQDCLLGLNMGLNECSSYFDGCSP